MNKHRKIGGTWFSPEEYQNFVSLSKEEQIKYVSDRLSPKDPAYAETLLKKVPNGNSSGTISEVKPDKANRSTGRGSRNDNAQSGATEA